MAKRFLQSLVLLAWVLLTAGCAAGNNVSGEWSGRMTQPGNPQAKDGFNLVFRLSQKGASVTGTSRIEVPQSEYFGVMTLEGTVNHDTLYIKDVAVIDEKPRTRWCMKQAELFFNIRTNQLTGPWTAEGCSPGEIELTKTK
jgi:hypothetical protein